MISAPRATVSGSSSTQFEKWHELTGDFCFVDVGSRGGFREMPLLHPFVHMLSLDANPDALIAAPEFASFRHFAMALYSAVLVKDLFVTEEPELTSLLEFDESAFDRHFGLMSGAESWKKGYTVQRTDTVTTEMADAFFRGQGLSRIDFFKLDTQGTELDVLKGAERYLAEGKISVIKAEVTFHAVYRKQCCFSDVDRLLKEHGYVFVDCRFASAASKNQMRHEGPRGLLSGDAIYVLDSQMIQDADRTAAVTRAAAILNQLGYISLASAYLADCGYSDPSIDRVLKATAAVQKLKTQFRRLLQNQLPPWLYEKLVRYYRRRRFAA